MKKLTMSLTTGKISTKAVAAAPRSSNITELAAFFPDPGTASNAALRKSPTPEAKAELADREKAGVVVAGGTTDTDPNVYTGTIYTITGEAIWTKVLPNYARYSMTAAAHHKALRNAALSLVGCFRAEVVLTRGDTLIQTHHFIFRDGDFLVVDTKPEAPKQRGLTLDTAGKTAITEAAKAAPSRVLEAQKPSTVTKVKVNLKARAKVVKKVPAPKAPKVVAPPPEPKFNDWMIWSGDTVIDVLMGEHEPLTKAEAQKKATTRYDGPVLVTTVAEGHARNAYLNTLKKGKARKEKAQKAPKAKQAKAPSTKKAPAAPKGELSEAMKQELIACFATGPTAGKMGSCMRMHLKMRGMLNDSKAGTLSDAGKAFVETIAAAAGKAGKKAKK